MYNNIYIRIAAALISLVLMVRIAPVYQHNTALEAHEEDLPLLGRIIILDAGHGRGADNVFEGYSEHTTMLILAHRLRVHLELLGATVHMTRSTAEDVNLFARASYMNALALHALQVAQISDVRYHAENGSLTDEMILSAVSQIAEIERLLAISEQIMQKPHIYAPIYMNAPFDHSHQREIHPDMQRIFELQDNPVIYRHFLVISLHSNATPRPINTAANGADVYVISNYLHSIRNYFTSWTNIERSELFADLILDEIDKLGITRRAIRNAAFVVLREHNLPAVLVENGFHTNSRDRAKLQCSYFISALAEGYVRAILAYFELIEEHN